MKQEHKRTAIITGSGRGIGKETVVILAKKSINVVIFSSTQNEINSSVEGIIKLIGNSNVLCIKCDVSVSSRVDSVIVNNAGVAFNRKLLDTSEEGWDQTINSNLKGAFLFTKAVHPYM